MCSYNLFFHLDREISPDVAGGLSLNRFRVTKKEGGESEIMMSGIAIIIIIIIFLFFQLK